MKRTTLWTLLFLVCPQLPAWGALVFVDLSSSPEYQNQSTPPPGPPPTNSVSVSSRIVSIADIAVGAGSYSLDFTISDSLGSSGLIEKMVRLDSRLGDVEIIFSPGPPEQATALAPGSLIDAGSNWYASGSKTLPLTRHIIVLGSTTNQGQWLDGQEHFAGFRFVDGASYHYGYVGFTITNFDTTPTLSISGYAYETSPGEGVVAGAIPEPAASVALAGVGALLFAARRRRR